jgi:putative endonuclease
VNKRETGSRYEQIAADYLMKCGYDIQVKNFRCRLGEIDLIAQNEGYLCFIEVKYRSSTVRGFPSEAVDKRKIMRIVRTAQYYMLVNDIPQTTPCRFDVVDILDGEITVIKNAFDFI